MQPRYTAVDRRFLACEDLDGDGEGTGVIPTTRRIYLEAKEGSYNTTASTAAAMAAWRPSGEAETAVGVVSGGGETTIEFPKT